ncbi:MAG: ABC transporter permease subunit [Planctomycetes bacterium]|nr:ABC transporter permease subunit [Planctomycetota bacterium]
MILDNAVLGRELLTSLRARKSFVAHLVFILILCAIAYLAWPREQVPIALQAVLSRRLFDVFAIGQLALISILAPVFSAGAMTMEKENRCVDLLFTTPMSPFTILLGKFLSSIVYLLCIIFTSLPILSLCFVLGGVAQSEVAFLYIALLTVAITFGMIGLTCSTYFNRTHAALSVSYLVVLPATTIFLLLAVSMKSYVDFALVLLVACGILLPILVGMTLRRLAQPFSEVETSAEQEDLAEQVGLVLVPNQFPDVLLAPRRRNDFMPDGTNPILDKELRSEIFGRGTLLIRLIIQISAAVSIAFLPFPFTDLEPVYVAYLLAFTALVTPAFTCNSFTQERERGTFDLLVTSMVTPGQIIFGKLLASVRCSGVLTLFLTSPLILAWVFQSETFKTSEFFLQMGILWTTVFFTAVLALFYSLLFRTTLVSMITTYLTILFLFIAPPIARSILITFTGAQYGEIAWLMLPSPFFASFTVGNWAWQDKLFPDAQMVELWKWFLIGYNALSCLLLAVMWRGFEYFVIGARRSSSGTPRPAWVGKPE